MTDAEKAEIRALIVALKRTAQPWWESLLDEQRIEVHAAIEALSNDGVTPSV